MPRPRTDIRPRILEAARERFAATGVDATSLRSIASDAATSIGMIYYYFPTKDELFLAVVEDVYGRLLAELEAVLAGEHDFAHRALALYRRIAAASELERQVIFLVAREGFTSGQRRERIAHRFSRGHVPLIFRAVLGGVSAGELRSDVHPLVVMAATISLLSVALLCGTPSSPLAWAVYTTMLPMTRMLILTLVTASDTVFWGATVVLFVAAAAGQIVPRHRRVGEARRNREAEDALRGIGAGDGLVHRQHTALGGGVMPVIGRIPPMPGAAGNVDDASRPAGFQPMLYGKTGKLGGGGEVAAQGIFPPVQPFDVRCLQRAGIEQTGLVH